MLPQSNYTSVPPHMSSRTDWTMDGGSASMARSSSNLSNLSSMPRVLSTAHLDQAGYIPSSHYPIEAAEPAHHQPAPAAAMANYEVMPSDARSEANIDGPIRCWTDRCNGREFSSIGNYRRHFREQHRVSKKFFCQRCGRPFSRSTARNLHYEKKKCRSIQLDENGVPVSLPLKDGSESGEAFSPAASIEALSSDESRHGSVDSSFSPYNAMHGMTYAESATQPSYVPRMSGEPDMSLDWDQLTAWDDGSQFMDDTATWGYLDQTTPMEAPTGTRTFDLGPQTSSLGPWHRSGVLGY